jgi:hypothetical protein
LATPSAGGRVNGLIGRIGLCVSDVAVQLHRPAGDQPDHGCVASVPGSRLIDTNSFVIGFTGIVRSTNSRTSA